MKKAGGGKVGAGLYHEPAVMWAAQLLRLLPLPQSRAPLSFALLPNGAAPA